jgi:type I restriction enzyme S subunit
MAQSVYREWFGKVDATSLPEGWEATSLDKVSKNFDSKRVPLSSMKRAEMQGEYPYYGAAKVLDHVNDYIFDGKYLLIAEDGSVITTDGKPVLQMAYGKFWVNNHTHVLQGAGYISTEYLYLVLSQIIISGYITGAAQPKITQANLNRIPVILPPKELLLKFNKVFEDTFDLIETLNRKNANLRRTRDLLLPRLVSGEIELANE